jgi:hypothetical protein
MAIPVAAKTAPRVGAIRIPPFRFRATRVLNIASLLGCRSTHLDRLSRIKENNGRTIPGGYLSEPAWVILPGRGYGDNRYEKRDKYPHVRIDRGSRFKQQELLADI